MTIINTKQISLAMTVLIGAATLNCFAEEERGERPRHPPKEAVMACEVYEEGDYCSFEGRHQEMVEGVCVALDEDEPIACKPER